MADCLFCKIIAGVIPSHKIYEDDAVVAFLDIHPVSTGHTLVVPKAHSTSLLDISSDDAQAVMIAIKKISAGLLAGVDADGLNLGSNCGESAGQDVFHTHIHLMPRQTGTPRTFVQMTVSQDDLAATAEKIRQHLV
mgnify:CR=1 FL=1